MKLYDLFDLYLESAIYSPNTYKTVSNYISKIYKDYFKNVDLEEITSINIAGFIKFEQAIKLRDNTIYTYYKILKIIFNFAIKNNFIAENPCKNVHVKHVSYVPRNLDYSKKYIKQLLKLFKKTEFYTLVFLDLHTRITQNRIIKLKKREFYIQKSIVF